MKALKLLLSFFVLLLVGYVLYLNVKLYYRPAYSLAGANLDLQKQWRFLKDKMHAGEDRKMQQLFPEGYMFMNALHGIFSAELAGAQQQKDYKDMWLESYRCYVNMNSDEARRIFPQGLLLPYGAYYNGWSTYHMGKLIAAERGGADTELSDTFKLRCQTIALAMNRQENPYLESYSQFAWPADMLMCVAALAEHDKLYPPLYESTIAKWVSEVKLRADSLGMLPHRVDYLTGMPAEAARGSSMSLMLCFLKEVDTDLYNRQLALYNKYFVTSRFGLPGIREYALGTEGEGDADSGPVLLGVGGSASIVGLRVMATQKDAALAIGLRNSIEAFGMATQSTTKKKYLFGALPMADAFIAWANATELTLADELHTTTNWRSSFQIYSALVFAICLLVLLLLWRTDRKK